MLQSVSSAADIRPIAEELRTQVQSGTYQVSVSRLQRPFQQARCKVMPMTGLDALAATLRAEVQIIEELLELGKAKRQLMADADEIAAIAAKEQEMLPGLEALEKERLVLTDVISGGKSWEEALADLGEDGQEIGALVQRLAENVRRLKEVNDLNQELLRETLHFVQFSLNVLTDDTPVTYDQSGQTSSGKSIFDRKV